MSEHLRWPKPDRFAIEAESDFRAVELLRALVEADNDALDIHGHKVEAVAEQTRSFLKEIDAADSPMQRSEPPALDVERLSAALRDAEYDGWFGPNYDPHDAAEAIIERYAQPTDPPAQGDEP
jgi:collagenase-like PrtC family protease